MALPRLVGQHRTRAWNRALTVGLCLILMGVLGFVATDCRAWPGSARRGATEPHLRKAHPFYAAYDIGMEISPQMP